MPTAIQAASGKAEEEPILDLYRRRIRVPAETWRSRLLHTPMPTGADAERFRGVVDNAAGRRLGVAGVAEDPRDRP